MIIAYDPVKEVTADLSDRSLRRIPESLKAAFRKALATEAAPQARRTRECLMDSARARMPEILQSLHPSADKNETSR